MTICQECLKAAAVAWCGFRAECRGCTARSAARSWQYAQAARGGENADYKALLKRLGLKHTEVQAARAADAMNTTPAA